MPLPFAARTIALIVLLTASNVAQACLNDRDSDSLAVEGGKLPNVVAVITGRFERNPPLFYQMRRARVARELAVSPKNLELYDDIAVACDRLGNDDEAIVWIEKKRRFLEGQPRTEPRPREAWYRYYANIGTFRVHRWIHAGAKVSSIGELKQARSEIAQALLINPNAHFGRERYQLGVMDWILTVKKQGKTGELPEPLNDYLQDTVKDTPDKAITGLSGLVVLGAAWESVDVFGALGSDLSRMRSNKVGYLAQLRVRELLDKGKISLCGNAVAPEEREYYAASLSTRYKHFTNAKSTEAKYRELRTEAEIWHKARTQFMLSRLRAGHHPDTDSTFWQDYTPASPPSLDVPWQGEWQENLGNTVARNGPAILFFVVFGVFPTLVWGCIKAAPFVERWVEARK